MKVVKTILLLLIGIIILLQGESATYAEQISPNALSNFHASWIGRTVVFKPDYLGGDTYSNPENITTSLALKYELLQKEPFTIIELHSFGSSYRDYFWKLVGKNSGWVIWYWDTNYKNTARDADDPYWQKFAYERLPFRFSTDVDNERKAHDDLIKSLMGRDIWVNKGSRKAYAYSLQGVSHLEHLIIADIYSDGLGMPWNITLKKDDGTIVKWNPTGASDIYANKLQYMKSNIEEVLLLDNPFDKYQWSQEVWDLIKLRKIRQGWNREMVLMSWGEPQHINRTSGSWGTNEQWVYSASLYVYFDNGVVTAIQN